MSRAVVMLGARAIDDQALQRRVQTLAQTHREVLVAPCASDDEPLALPRRWATLRSLLSSLPEVWVTPLVSAAGLHAAGDRLAALTSRLGAIDQLWLEDPALLPLALALGLPAQALGLMPTASAESRAEAPLREPSRALLVTRAQPLHRGHWALLEHALSLADEAILLVAAAERSHSTRDPFTAGERLMMVRAALGALAPRVWLLAVPAPPWPSLALPQLAFMVPSYQLVVAHNPVLIELARQHGKQVARLPTPVHVEGQPLSATRVRARLSVEGVGPWLEEALPSATAALLASTPSLAQRCALVARADAGL